LVEDVKVALVVVLPDDARLFEEKVGHLAADRLAAREHELDVLALKIRDTFSQNLPKLTNLELLSLRTVLALPNASNSGFVSRMTSLMCCTR